MNPIFAALASLLLPADGGGVAAEASPRWDLAALEDLGTGPAVWGRAPRAGSGRGAIREAAARERALRSLRSRPPPRFGHVAVHRWPPPEFRAAPLRGAVRASLRSGALVELAPEPFRRVLDACAEAAGLRGRPERFRPFTAGAAMVLEEDRVLKAAAAGGPGSPVRAAAALRRLAEAGVTHVPPDLGSGTVPGAGWSLEGRLPGRRPRWLRPPLVRELVRFAGGLPRGEVPAGMGSDLSAIGEAFPEHADALRSVAAGLDEAVGALPSILVHGDLWAGNVLTEGERLVGVIDWDSWHPAGVPGIDLLHAFAAERMARAGRALGEVWLERPWRSAAFGAWTERYWAALGIRPDRSALEAIGAAWWARRVAYRLSVRPALAADPRWAGVVVTPVVRALAR